jgi:hypothetical protein
MLSGDEPAAVRRMADSLGLADAKHSLKPGDKGEVIAAHQRHGRRVLFVGDGVNDAPALARADLGVAMAAAGTDVALDTAGMALTRDDITRLPFVVSLSRRMLMVIKMNIGLGLLSNTVAVYGGMSGLLSPIAASLLHNAGSILVVLASASLLLYKDRTPARDRTQPPRRTRHYRPDRPRRRRRGAPHRRVHAAAHRILRALSSWSRRGARTGITLQQMHTLEILGSGGEMRMKELAGR